MTASARRKTANTVIVAATLAGGLVLTHHFAPADTSTASPSGSGSGTSTGSGSNSGSGSGTSTGSGSGNSTGSGSSASASKTVTSADIPYQFGDVQVTVTKANGKITNIDVGNSTASAGRDQAFPILVQQAIASQGSNFGNLSGATYTTDAFKQALDSAISKLG